MREQPEDVPGDEALATQGARLEQAPELYRTFHSTSDGCVKVVLTP